MDVRERRGIPPQDHAEAAKWFRKAPEQGDAKAQNTLGVMSTRGLGVPPDYAKTAKWFRKAADQGDGKGRENLERFETLLENQRK